MDNVINIFFWLGLVSIPVVFFLSFYIPGRVFIGNQQIKHHRMVHISSIVLGIVMWAWQGYVFGLINARWLSYVYLLIFAGLYLYKKYYAELRTLRNLFKIKDVFVLIIVIPGILAQTLPYVQMGINSLTTHNLDDHIWHASLIRELMNSFPPQEPGMAGIILKDYHFWFNLVTADIIRVFHLPALTTQFIGMYILASIMLGFVGYYLAKLIYDRKIFTGLFIFFLYYAGDAVGWYMLIFQQRLDFNISSLINNGTKLVDSPAYGYSLIIGLCALYLLFQESKKMKKTMIIICTLMFASLMEFKVYTGITFMMGLGMYALYGLLNKQFDKVLVFILSSALGALVFFPNITLSGGLFFLPFEIPRDFITQKSLGLYEWDWKWRVYQDNNNYIRIFQYGVYMSFVYLIIQFGIQLLGLFPSKRIIKILDHGRFFALYTIPISALILGLSFYQQVGGANIWEFFLPGGVILALFTALIITKFIENKALGTKFLVILLLIIFVIPRWYITFKEDFIKEFMSGYYGIKTAEKEVYSYMEKSIPVNDIVLIVNQMNPIVYVSSVKMFTGSKLYYSGDGVRQKVTPEINKRRAVLDLVRKGLSDDVIEILKKEQIKYIFYYNRSKPLIYSEQVKNVFNNDIASIYKIE